MADQVEQGRRRNRGARIGVVSSVSGAKTVRVIVENLVRDPQYQKTMRRRTKLAVHDAGNVAREGDTVEIAPCRRLSKTKSWRLVRVVRASAMPSGPVE